MKDIGTVRKYGNSPYTIVLVHGGPGVPGEMKPVAIELSKSFGILEPFQSKNTIEGQLEELKLQVEENSKIPIILIGWSWGSWLAYIFASRYPELVKKLVIISSGPFEASYIPRMKEIRFSHLSEVERNRIAELETLFQKEDLPNKDALFEEYGSLYSKADTFESNGEEDEQDDIQPQMAVYNGVWPEAAKLRETGDLLKYGKNIKCEVVAIQGAYDPHLSEGVRVPLSKVLTNFRFIELDKCGHHPWYEKFAKEKFYEILIRELLI